MLTVKKKLSTGRVRHTLNGGVVDELVQLTKTAIIAVVAGVALAGVIDTPPMPRTIVEAYRLPSIVRS